MKKASVGGGLDEEDAEHFNTNTVHKNYNQRRTLFPNAVPTENLGYYTMVRALVSPP